MSDRLLGRLRWGFLAAAIVLLVVFLFAQQQHGADVSYARSPSGSASVEGDAGELTGAKLPSVRELTEALEQDSVVRLPGAVAYWDEQRVAAAIGDADIRVLVAPPGLSKAQQDRLREVENATIRVVGTSVVGTLFSVVSDDLAGWRGQFATGDVTGLLLALIAEERDRPAPPDPEPVAWRAPTEAELAPVVADLRADGLYVAPGATLESVPDSAGTAFPDRAPVVAAFPQQPFGQPVPDFGSALARLFPGTPVVVMYGSWVSYAGPDAAEFADVAAGGFYGRFGERLSLYAYPQGSVLNVYLGKVTDVRYAGLFDRPLPYQPFDPLRVALPALPWLFTVCVLVFLVVSVRSVVGRRAPQGSGQSGQLAGLTALAVEMSALSRGAALTRALTRLESARSAVDEGLPDVHVAALLAQARGELDTAARELGRSDYRPANYLAGGEA